jgi:hypothetical protein
LKAIWLEFEVDNEKATVAKLEALEMQPFEYFSKPHKYSQASAGKCSVWPNSSSPYTHRRLIFGSEKAVRF